MSTQNLIMMDEVSTFSVTHTNIASEMTSTLLALPLVSRLHPSPSIIDATACVGGNSVSFCASFSSVTSVELDAGRCETLRHNLYTVIGEERRRGKPMKCERPTVLRGDCLDVVIGSCTTRQDVIFLDPPWGGVDYKSVDKVQLALSAVPLFKICKAFGMLGKYVALKLPLNADISGFDKDGFRPARKLVDKKFKNMWFLVYEYERELADGGGEATHDEARRRAESTMNDFREEGRQQIVAGEKRKR